MRIIFSRIQITLNGGAVSYITLIPYTLLIEEREQKIINGVDMNIPVYKISLGTDFQFSRL